MEVGDILTRSSVWLATLCFVFGLGLRRWAPLPAWRRRIPRALWTIGCLACLAHILFAFHFHHHWRHAEAYEDTARQTGDLIGIAWGGGVYFNYAMVAVWMADTFWWWACPRRYAARPGWISAAVDVFFAFMFVNGAVVFHSGPIRWMGLGAMAALATLWAWSKSRSCRPNGRQSGS